MINYEDFMQLIDKRIKEKTEIINGILCKVEKVNGMYVDVKLLSQDTNITTLSNIPVVQSKYMQVIIQKGDIILLLNISIDISNLLKEVSSLCKKRNYYIGIPLLLKSEYDNEEATLKITSNTQKSIITLNNEKLEFQLEKDFKISAEGKCELEFQEEINMQTKKDFLLKSQEKIDIGGKNINLKSQQDFMIDATQKFSIEGMQTEIKSQMPMKIGNSATIGQILNDICMQIITLGSTPTAPGAPVNPAIAAIMATIQAKINANFS